MRRKVKEYERKIKEREDEESHKNKKIMFQE
jgi:hypothetical protein